ncbi:MAG: hypothetical protein IPG86_00390 [Chitinophagaceae bacterium]|nr:hypothetical protein [Chitinophagaceae bacterium]
MNKMILCLVVIFSLGHAQAQGTDERVYIQTDRNTYAIGETIYFKGYITAGYDSILSIHLFVELRDSALNRIADIVAPVSAGTTSGSITIPSSSTGKIFLRAYTDISARQAEPFQFIRQVVGMPATGPITERPVFYPEGGKLVLNCLNFMAFKAPAGAAGTIRNSKGEAVAAFNTAKGNTGSFRIRTMPGEIYRCHWNAASADSVFEIPGPVTNGIAIHINYFDDTLYYDLDNGGSKDPLLLKPVLQLLIGDHLAYKVNLDLTQNPKFSYFIPVGSFRPGPALIKLVDANENVLASRPVFLPGNILEQETELEIVKKDLGVRGTNEFRLNFPDTALQFVAISITDAEEDKSGGASGLLNALLPDELKPVQSAIDPDQRYREIDLLLQTSFIPEKSKAVRPSTSGAVSNKYLQLRGKVSSGKKLLSEKEILVMIRSASSGKKIYKVTTDDKGSFLLDDLILFGDSYIYCKLPGKSDEELNTELFLELPKPDSSIALMAAFQKKVNALMQNQTGIVKIKANGQVAARVDTIVYGDRVIVLEEAVVSTNNRKVHEKRLEDLEKRYIDGTGFGGYVTQGETIDVMNDPVAGKTINLFSYIASKMRSLKLKYVRGRPELFYPIRAIAGDTIIRTYYLNNIKIDRDMVDLIRLDEVAVVKFVPMLGSDLGLPPAIAIFTKKTGDQGYWEKDSYKGKEYLLKGYPLPRDLPVPDYSRSDLKVVNDSRKTLYWMPDMRVDNGSILIRFYNNDLTKKIRIRAEGITASGNIIWFEQELQ